MFPASYCLSHALSPSLQINNYRLTVYTIVIGVRHTSFFYAIGSSPSRLFISLLFLFDIPITIVTNV